MDLRSQRVLITGAGGGIGRALTAALAARGARLCALVHNPDSADQLRADLATQGVTPLILGGDITTSPRPSCGTRP
jgi:NAD(P)-dependent dehydrogenase (short-subunit alcohol dehydrogenase family)